MLTPDDETNNAIIYCFAVAAQLAEVDLLDFNAMSNHLHYVLYDLFGHAPVFFEHCHKLLAKCLNAYRERCENFFSPRPTSAVELLTRDAVIEKMAYTATNPVKAGLVERVADWPGASGYSALISDKPITATRPKYFFAKDGDMPETVTLELKVPAKFGDRGEFIRDLKARVAEIEAEEAAKRAKLGKRVVGRAAILRQSWTKKPKSANAAVTSASRKKIRPTVAARDPEVRIAALQRNQAFQRAYRAALKNMRAGAPIPFPYGTYRLRLAGLPVAAAPTEKTN
jgi:putative transposase